MACTICAPQGRVCTCRPDRPTGGIGGGPKPTPPPTPPTPARGA